MYKQGMAAVRLGTAKGTGALKNSCKAVNWCGYVLLYSILMDTAVHSHLLPLQLIGVGDHLFLHADFLALLQDHGLFSIDQMATLVRAKAPRRL